MLNRIKKILRGEIWNTISLLCRPDAITQIRMRTGCPLIVNMYDREILCKNMVITEEMIQTVFNRITEYSAYAFEDSIKRGYITIGGGHRIGIGGEAVMECGQIVAMKNIRFLNIRIVHCMQGCGNTVVKEIAGQNKLMNTLIISPPGMGKTTLLRDVIRIISNNMVGTSICVIDERNEISGSYMGTPTVDLGPRTDVISNCSKEEGIEMAVRAMAPEIIAVDEIGNRKDLAALKSASVCGVKIIATIHGNSLSDAEKKLGHACDKIFEKKVLIKSKGEYICY